MKKNILNLLTILSITLLSNNNILKTANINKNNTELHEAAKSNNINKIKDLLNIDGKEAEDNESFYNYTIVRSLANKINWAKAKILYEYNIAVLGLKGARINPNIQNHIFETPLHLAVNEGHEDTVELLLNNKANTYHKNANNNIPLHYATAKCHTDIGKLLLEKGGCRQVKEKNLQGMTPLHIAAKKNCSDLVNLLLTYNAQIHAQDKYGNTPLDYNSNLFDDIESDE